ncbi:glucan biosynthesis protein [Hirschia baltica]|uniref:Glucans biosynthesis protein G n=1 Tax=Hirschia baltica (strain ATCC 49814 / DSM 5838 / IFAM 1418) TaxID=582402 RepID=C6XLL3_HIRBI|nr:glucan biosynthesis protein G [Hirschia baltica]ACT57919.1 periplasmic glucan biosynthesis protein MdoG [Hirschia baltica ATCC 49814]
MSRPSVTLLLSWMIISIASCLPASSAPANTPDVVAPANTPFSFDLLSQVMESRSKAPYQAPSRDELPELLSSMTYDEHRAIRHNPEKAYWKDQSTFEMQAFHLGGIFWETVRVYEIKDDKVAPVGFSSSDFIYRPPLDPANFENFVMPGVAGFRLAYPLNNPDYKDELVSFIGASYFRALGEGSLYGLSARGLSVNTATAAGEEFPRFSDFYIETPEEDATSITVYAALDSKSVTGAYKFVITPGPDTIMDVTARLYFRDDVARLGVAPLTSMYLYSDSNHRFDDYRGRVHDSDGLKIIRENGDELWRNLNNPQKLANSYFTETNPKAFGLMQRNRDFDMYQDAEAHYERRPSLLVEPKGEWGKGQISLVEIPTDLEINDNIVAFWTPADAPKAGDFREYEYRLSWGDVERPNHEQDVTQLGNSDTISPDNSDTKEFARVIGLRGGMGGVSGTVGKNTLRKFVVDFEGGALENLPEGSDVKSVINISRGQLVHSSLSRIGDSNVWRLVLDARTDSDAPMELNAFLENGNERLSEIWLYQWRSGDEKPY